MDNEITQSKAKIFDIIYQIELHTNAINQLNELKNKELQNLAELSKKTAEVKPDENK